MVLNGPRRRLNKVIYETTNGDLVKNVVVIMTGTAGPSGFDVEQRNHMLNTGLFKTHGEALANAIAELARTLATDTVENKEIFEPILNCRSIPLDKKPGLRPIRIGETLRRLICKAVVYAMRAEIQESSGAQQLCAG